MTDRRAAARSRMLTIAEIAERLRVSERQARRVAAKVGKTDGLVQESEFERYVAYSMRSGSRKGRESIGRHPLVEMLADDGVQAVRDLPPCCFSVGFTYFVEAASLIKIGKTENIRNRMLDLQTGSPIPLRLVAVSRGADLEEHLHAELFGRRAHGEWFDADPVRRLLARYASAVSCLRCTFLGGRR